MIAGGLVVAILAISIIGVLVFNGTRTKPDPPPNPPTPGPVVPEPPTPSSPGTVVTDNLSVAPPPGWQLKDKKPDTIVFVQPDKAGLLEFFSAKQQPAQTPQQLIQTDLVESQKNHPDATLCYGPVAATFFNGANAAVGAVCYTATNGQGGSSARRRIYVEAVSADGTIEFSYDVAGPEDQIKALALEADASARTVQWKLPAQ